MKENEELIVLSEEIKGTQKILTALGDEMRQHLILVMTQSGNCSGMRVNDIAEKTSLSRPAVSHKLKTLADVSETGANDVYHVRTGDGREVLIPVIPDVVREISLEDGCVRIFRMKGLFE